MAPCSLGRAVAVATSAAVTPTLRLVPGTFTTPLTVAAATLKPLVVVATGATIVTSATSVSITDGATVEIRGLTTRAPERHIVCGGSAGLPSRLVIRDAMLEKSANNFGAIEVERCRLDLSTSTISMLNTEIIIAAASDSTIHADRIRDRDDGLRRCLRGGLHVQQDDHLE